MLCILQGTYEFINKGAGVNGAIQAAAGSELLLACQRLYGKPVGNLCDVGDAKWTEGFKIPRIKGIYTDRSIKANRSFEIVGFQELFMLSAHKLGLVRHQHKRSVIS